VECVLSSVAAKDKSSGGETTLATYTYALDDGGVERPGLVAKVAMPDEEYRRVFEHGLLEERRWNCPGPSPVRREGAGHRVGRGEREPELHSATLAGGELSLGFDVLREPRGLAHG
jgi:hypothetical protein